MKISEFPFIQDIKREYITLRRNGMGRYSATTEMQRRYHNELSIGLSDDGILFWIGMAIGQYTLKELECEVANRGLASLEELATNAEISHKEKEIYKLKFSVEPMAECKVSKKQTQYRCQWKLGDTFAYCLRGPEAEENGLEGQYMLLRKVDEFEETDGRLLPIVTFTLWDSPVLPTTSDEFGNATMLKLSSRRFGLPDDLFEYRAKIMFTGRKQLGDFQFVGNFQTIQIPKDEVIIRQPGCTLMIFPKQFSRKCCVFWNLHQYYVGNLQHN